MEYPGGKNGAGVYQKLINLMPPHQTYIEPFLGSGAIMRLKRAATRSIGLDQSRDVVRTWQACIAGKDGGGRSPNLAMLDPASPVPTISAARAESGDGRRRRTLFPAMMDPRSLIVRRGDGIQFLQGYDFQGNELVYCDPPYLVTSTRQAITRPIYKHEVSDLQHRELLRCLRSLKAMVLISGYPSEMYSRGLPGWNCLEFQSAIHRGRTATECVWYNFPTPVELHDYRYLGSTFREREQIKRMKQRWIVRLSKMEPLKRQALLSALEDR